ncbi:hypothetical protein HYR54_14390 [Candidatus Acetothermia bacterium]|nr:hypothetical protein [Candidatus Acetothermia bacterium]
MKHIQKFAWLLVVLGLVWALGFHDALGQSLRIKVIAVFSQDPNDSSGQPISDLEIMIGSASVVTGSDGVVRTSVSPGSYIVKVRKELLVDDQGIEYRVGFVNVHVTKEPGAGRKCAPTSREGDVTVRFDASASNPQALSEYELAVRIVPNDAPPLQGGETDCAGPPPPICSMELATVGGNIRASDEQCSLPPTITGITIPLQFIEYQPTSWSVEFKNPGKRNLIDVLIEEPGTLVGWNKTDEISFNAKGLAQGSLRLSSTCREIGVLRARVTISNIDGSSDPVEYSIECVDGGVPKPGLTPAEKDALKKSANNWKTTADFADAGFLYCLKYTAAQAKLICALIGGLVKAGLKLRGDYLTHIVDRDPPDPNYKVIAQPKTPNVPPIKLQPGLPKGVIDAANALLRNDAQTIGLEVAYLSAIERAQGAFFANDPMWFKKQMDSATRFASQLAKLMKSYPSLTAKVDTAWQAAGLPDFPVTANDFRDFQSSVAANGLPQDLVNALTQFGADSATIARIRSDIMAQDPNQITGSFLQSVSSPELSAAVQGTAQAFNQFATGSCKALVSVDFSYIGFGEDKVGDSTHQPDGKGDGHFRLQLNRLNNAKLTLLKLETVDDNGQPAFGQVWDTDPNQYGILGIENQKGQKLNPTDKAIAISVAKNTFELFANDTGYFNAGQRFLITAVFADGCVAQGLVAVSQGTGTQTSLLKVDDGTYEMFVGFPSGTAKAYFVNRLTPSSYPATLQNVQIHFTDRSNGLKLNDPITLLIGTNPSGNTNINSVSFQKISTTVKALNQFNQYDLSPTTINSGDFVVGFLTNNPSGIYPIDQDTTAPSQGRSYLSTNGTQFFVVDSYGANLAGNFAIRATVSLGGSSASMKAEEHSDLLLLLINKLNLEMRDGQLIVDAHGTGIAALQVQIFDLTGRRLLNRMSNSSVLALPVTNQMGRLLPNGVYLYVISVRGNEGDLIRSELKKLILLR